jgi:23S rRNA pseudouridine1911/1915/1917 synthase
MSIPLRVRHLLSSKTLLLSEFILSQLEISREYFLQLLDLGAVYLNQKRIEADQVLHPGDYVRVHVLPKRFPQLKLDPSNYVIAWEKDFVIFNKPQGVPCHPTVDNRKENLITYFETFFGHRFYLTHRLDVGTGGVWLLGLTPEFQKQFNSILQNRQSEKKYYARVEKTWQLPTGLLTHYMKPSLRAPREVFAAPFEGSMTCELEIENAHVRSDMTTDLEIRLITGRTHQIRSQISFMGHPVVGDTMYGSPHDFKQDLEERWALWARELTFTTDDRTWLFKLPEESLQDGLRSFTFD